MRKKFSISMSQMNRFSYFRDLYNIFERRFLGKKFLSDNEHIDFEKKCQKLYRVGKKPGDQLGSGGKPSTWFPPGILVELPPVAISCSKFSSEINKTPQKQSRNMS